MSARMELSAERKMDMLNEWQWERRLILRREFGPGAQAAIRAHILESMIREGWKEMRFTESVEKFLSKGIV